MVYIPLNDNLFDHPKTQKAARRLGITEVQLVGHLSALWLWCLSYAEDGDLSDYEPEEVAAAARWKDEPEAFITALVECGRKGGHGFLESSSPGMLIVHDYDEYVGKLIDRRKANAERMRQSRSGQSPATQTAQPPKHPAAPSAATPSAKDTAEAPDIAPDLAPDIECETPVGDTSGTSFSVQDTCVTRVELDKQRQTKQNKDKQSEDNNNQEERSAEERNSPAAPDDTLIDPECRVVVVSSLCKLGVSELVAEDLTRRRTCEQITKQVEWLPYRVAEREGTPKPVRDPAALLVKAIEDGYAPPISYSRLKQAQADKAHKALKSEEKAQHEQAEAARAGQERMETVWQSLADDEQADIGQEAEAVLLSESFFADLARKTGDGWRQHRGAVPRLLAQRNALLLARGHVPT